MSSKSVWVSRVLSRRLNRIGAFAVEISRNIGSNLAGPRAG